MSAIYDYELRSSSGEHRCSLIRMNRDATINSQLNRIPAACWLLLACVSKQYNGGNCLLWQSLRYFRFGPAFSNSSPFKCLSLHFLLVLHIISFISFALPVPHLTLVRQWIRHSEWFWRIWRVTRVPLFTGLVGNWLIVVIAIDDDLIRINLLDRHLTSETRANTITKTPI